MPGLSVSGAWVAVLRGGWWVGGPGGWSSWVTWVGGDRVRKRKGSGGEGSGRLEHEVGEHGDEERTQHRVRRHVSRPSVGGDQHERGAGQGDTEPDLLERRGAAAVQPLPEGAHPGVRLVDHGDAGE